MPIKNRGKYLRYQREYNKKRKLGCRSLHPEPAISGSQPVYTPPKEQGVTTSPTSHVQGCKSTPKQIPNIPVNIITSNGSAPTPLVGLGAPPTRPTNVAKVIHPKRAAMSGSLQAEATATRKLDFSKLKIKRPITTVGAVDRFRLLEEITEALRIGNPVSGEELIRLRRVGAKV